MESHVPAILNNWQQTDSNKKPQIINEYNFSWMNAFIRTKIYSVVNWNKMEFNEFDKLLINVWFEYNRKYREQRNIHENNRKMP